MNNSNKSLLQQNIRSPLFIGGLICILVSVFSVFMLSDETFESQNSAQQRQFQAQLLNQLSVSLAPYLKAKDQISINQIIMASKAHLNLIGLTLSNAEGQRIAEFLPLTLPDDVLQVSQQITLQDSVLATLELIFPASEKSGLSIVILLGLTSVLAGVWFVISLVVNQQGKKTEQHLLGEFQQFYPNQNLSNLSNLATACKQDLKPSLQLSSEVHNSLSTDRMNHLVNRLDFTLEHSGFMDLVFLYATPLPEAFEESSSDTTATSLVRELSKSLERISSLYNGHFCQHHGCLVFGLEDEEQAATDALCAATLLENLCDGVAISVCYGSAWIEPGEFPHPINVQGQAIQELFAMQLSNLGQGVLLAENMFQHQKLNDLASAEIERDIILPNGSRLEIWRLESLASNYAKLISNQVEQLRAAS